jgi:hypothetical protein
VTDADVTARLARALDEHDVADSGLGTIASVLDVLASLERADPRAVDDLRTRLSAALSEPIATALCDGAQSPADIAERFKRMRHMLAARETLAG